MSTLGDAGHWFVLDWGSWVGGGLRVWSALNDSLRSFINFSISVCWAGKSSEYFLCTHEMQEYNLLDFDRAMIMYGGRLVQA